MNAETEPATVNAPDADAIAKRFGVSTAHVNGVAAYAFCSAYDAAYNAAIANATASAAGPEANRNRNVISDATDAAHDAGIDAALAVESSEAAYAAWNEKRKCENNYSPPPPQLN